MKTPPPSETEALRSDIDATRHRMDHTMEAIGDRLQGRHLVDEVLGFFGGGNSSPGEGRAASIQRSAQKAVRSVTDTVSANPVPALLIGAGIAWMVYSNRRSHRPAPRHEGDEGTTYSHEWAGADYERGGAGVGDEYLERPRRHDPVDTDGAGIGGRISAAKQKVSDATHRLSEKASAAGEQAREKLGHIKEGAQRLQQRAGETYQRTRERVVHDAQEHPLEMGLACLGAGLIAGLALPTPERVNRLAGPPMDRLRASARESGRSLVEKGRQAAREVMHRGEAQAGNSTPAPYEGERSPANDTPQGIADQSGPEQNESRIAANKPAPLGQDASTGPVAHD